MISALAKQPPEQWKIFSLVCLINTIEMEDESKIRQADTCLEWLHTVKMLRVLVSSIGLVDKNSHANLGGSERTEEHKV